jgi:colanic acid biosynthesis glycosyl transferase WcaI
MRILIICPHYFPDGGTASALNTRLCEELANRGHQVTALTAVPHYPSGHVPEDYRGKLKKKSIEKGVHVIRVALPSVDRQDIMARMFQFLAYQVGATLAGFNVKYDVCISTTAALQVWLPFALLSVARQRPSVYSVADIYPDVGIKLGVFKNKFIINFVRSLEDFCMKHATQVRVLSNSFLPILQSRNVPYSKMILIYDWIDTNKIKPLPHHNYFAIKNDLLNRFIVLYAGNLGYLQGLDHVLQTAHLLQDREDIHFIFVGDGSARDYLMENAKILGLNNTRFLPYQPFEQMPEVLATAHLSLVTLSKGISFGALPSKSFAIFASGRPLLASVDEGCELWNLIEKTQTGLCVPPEDPSRLADAILKLKQDEGLRERLGRNGRVWAEQYHSPQSAAKQFEELLSQISA